MIQVTLELNRRLCSLDAWDTFSLIKLNQNIIFDLNFNAWDLTPDNLVGVAAAIFSRLALIQHLNLDELEFLSFVRHVESGYQSNPYHSFHHAVDVCVVLFYSLSDLGLGARFATEDVLALMLAALCHDIGHPGVNNLYQVNAKTELAEAFNGTSVLENYSCQLTAKILDTCQLLRHTDPAIRGWITHHILATDMSFHFSMVDELSQLLERWPQAGLAPQPDRQRLCSMLLHAADISNAVRPWPLCKAWSDRVVSEFFNQGDLERRNELPISPNMDRNCSSQPQIALDFDEYIVKPFFEVLADFFPDSAIFLHHLLANRRRWSLLNRKAPTLDAVGPVRRVSFSAGTVIIPELFRDEPRSSIKTVPRGKRRQPPATLRQEACPPDKVSQFKFLVRIPSTDSLEHPVLS
ncbi:hypothetical protein L0F63_004430 [Massospora cicadina]|nr:hypothetical protein L0F63_004430 [Massospora cicadina]